MAQQPRSPKRMQHRRAVVAGQNPTANPAVAVPPPNQPDNVGATPNSNPNANNAGNTGPTDNTGTNDNTGGGNGQTGTGVPPTGNNGNTGNVGNGAGSSVATQSTSAATRPASQSAAPSSTTKPVVVAPSTQPTQTLAIVTSTSTPLPSTTVSAAAVVPTTMSGGNADQPVTMDPYTTFTSSHVFATDNWLSATSAAPTGTAIASTGPGAGSIVGIVAACLVGLICLAAAIGWLIRQQSRRKRERARYNRSRFARNSVAVLDKEFTEKPQMGTKNALALAKANNPTLDNASSDTAMAERHTEATSGAHGHQQAGYYDNNGQYVYDNQGYGNQYDYIYNHGNQAYGQDRHGYDTNNGYHAEGNQQSYYAQDGGHYQQDQYGENGRQLDVQDATETSAPSSNAATSRQLSTTYSSLNPRQPSKTYADAGKADRSGTPTDRNPQQTYFPPSDSAASSPAANKQTVNGRHRGNPTRALHRSDE